MVTPAGGTIDRVLNDGVLVYFGHPQADEHQAERALRTALKLVAARDQIDMGQLGALQIRIGVATGLAVVGGQKGTPGALGRSGQYCGQTGIQCRAGCDADLGQHAASRGWAF